MRIRSSDYYLEQVGGTPVALYPDESVGELAEQTIEVTEMRPTRVEGRERRFSYTTKRLAQVALHESLADYIAEKTLHPTLPGTSASEAWTLEDIPRDVVERFEAWRDAYDGPSTEQIVLAAAKLAASDDQLDNSMVACRHCGGESQYACYVCGTARQFYRYPLVRQLAPFGPIDRPFDIARAISLNPELTSLSVDYWINDQHRLEAKRSLIFRTDRAVLDDGSGQGADRRGVERSDRLYRPIELVVDYWSEDQAPGEQTRRAYMRRLPDGRQPQTADEYIEAMQLYIAQDIAKERAEDAALYEQSYQEMLRLAGQKGLILTFRHKYMGMGETDAHFALSRGGSDFESLAGLSYDIDVRQAILTTLPKLRSLGST